MVEREPKRQKTSSFHDIFKGWSSLQFVQNEKTRPSYNKSKQLKFLCDATTSGFHCGF
jgi:hypothetical protein